MQILLMRLHGIQLFHMHYLALISTYHEEWYQGAYKAAQCYTDTEILTFYGHISVNHHF